ncbi:UDP-N-acetylglucosamine 2-epimerase [Leekyejoonella antrihumi]|uniref:UDP-N-acetylglucosamine 2-epimerase n=1 Tax=Leekyejoonella antrihumi TaxID=1660198 RepID=UPI001645E8C0|nr:UDP-N-acetylglucosamine 2-epimerase [Leekyejoonella antrihumi]
MTRTSTERQEGVAAGTLRLIGTDTEAIVATARELLDSEQARWQMATALNPYGDGHAADCIVATFAHVAFGAPEPQPYGCGFNRLAVLRAAGFDTDPRPQPTLAPAFDRDVPRRNAMPRPAQSGMHGHAA